MKTLISCSGNIDLSGRCQECGQRVEDSTGNHMREVRIDPLHVPPTVARLRGRVLVEVEGVIRFVGSTAVDIRSISGPYELYRMDFPAFPGARVGQRVRVVVLDVEDRS